MIFAMLAAVVVAAAAPAAPRAPALDPAAVTAARALVQQLDVQGQVNRSLNQNVEMMRSGVAMRSMLAQQPGFAQAYAANRPRFDAALKNAGAIQAKVAEKVIRENTGAIAEMAVTAYARNYSAAEIQGLAAFFKTPLGQALNSRQGRVTAEIGQASTRMISEKIDAGMKAAAPQLQAALAPLNAPPPAKPAPKK
ncbi:MAG: DUF2059 domain-containing protein [Sandarakinorhabdus sp.]|nr:DUF2059 domain-containing protein [Sandarakinorhabdus sp.]